ncbi:hypothetical protein L5515_007270 [Caenorhabditis briggsae]|uniref:CHK kinase-like domain-containing protein n=1 Tax=Caenorhabditis briggsae TaxID=6238 RepID=A0AAE9F2N2_CAEBR|nr:hypothetical protein L5515_007270 [Caenorhabditis briggsae]
MATDNSLTILEDGNGLFGTHVTLKDVNDAIREQMDTDLELTPKSKMTVIGDGNGFSSCVILISCKWNKPSDTLPHKIVLKVVSFSHIKALISKAEKEGIFKKSENEKKDMNAHFEISIQRIHNQEVDFYNVLKKGEPENLLILKVYFTSKFDENNKTKGFIGMEYVEGSETRHSYENCTVKEIQPVLKAIAHIQALTVSTPEEEIEKTFNDSSYTESMKSMMEGDRMTGIFMHTKNQNPERFGELVARVERLAPGILDFEKACNLNKYIGINKNVFVHGDLWSANILFAPGKDASMYVRKVLDYQLAHMGNPAEDLVRFLCSTLSGSDRRQNWERLLEDFYAYFLEAMQTREIPYTLEQLKLSYRSYFPMGGLALLPLLGPAVDVKLKSMSEQTAEKYQKVLAEKIECLLEDVEKFYLETV